MWKRGGRPLSPHRRPIKCSETQTRRIKEPRQRSGNARSYRRRTEYARSVIRPCLLLGSLLSHQSCTIRATVLLHVHVHKQSKQREQSSLCF